MMKVILLSFLAEQALFTVLDLWALKTESLAQIPWRRLSFLLGIWFVYLGLQSLGAALLPNFDAALGFFSRTLGVTLTGPTHWSWLCTLVWIWSYQVITFWDFVTHRWILHSRIFWLFHEHHHLPKIVMNGIPGISVRPYAFVATLLTYVCCLGFIWAPTKYFLAAPEQVSFVTIGLPILALVLALQLTLDHSVFLRRYWAVHHVMKIFGLATPQEHVLHHSRTRRCNFGNFSSVWDRLFGSYADPAVIDIKTEPLGLSYDQDYLGALCRGRVKLPAKIRDRYQLGATVCLED